MNDIRDIKAVQKVRPDLTDGQAEDVLGFLSDVYDDKPYKVEDTARLFKVAADMIFKEAV